MFGGSTKNTDSYALSRTISVFNGNKKKWITERIEGSPPDALYEGACCSSATSGDIYFFGGRCNSVFAGALFKLSTNTNNTYTWTQLSEDPQISQPEFNQAPMKKMASGIACFTDKNKLITFGGYGEPHVSRQLDSKYIKIADRVWSNEIHEFDITNGT